MKYGDDEKKLGGAVFLLEKKQSDCTLTAIKWYETGGTWAEDTNQEGTATESDGSLVFADLEAGTYYTTEILAPEGYSLLKDTIEVTLPYEIKKLSSEDKPADYDYSVVNCVSYRYTAGRRWHHPVVLCDYRV